MSIIQKYIKELADNSEPLNVKKGVYLFKEGDSNKSLYFLLSGKVRVLKSKYMLWTAQSRELVGLSSFFSERSIYDFSVKASVDSEVIKLNANSIMSIVSKDPIFSRAIMQILCERVKMAQNRTISLLETPAKNRLINEIIIKSNNVGKTEYEFSIEELSEAVGISIRLTRQLLKKLEKRKLLEHHQGTLIIHDETGLRIVQESGL
jgi:CRP/FNR family transcriptional regulator